MITTNMIEEVGLALDAINSTPKDPMTITTIMGILGLSRKEVEATPSKELIVKLENIIDPEAIATTKAYKHIESSTSGTVEIYYDLDMETEISKEDLKDGMTYEEFLNMLAEKDPTKVPNEVTFMYGDLSDCGYSPLNPEACTSFSLKITYEVDKLDLIKLKKEIE